MTIRGMLFDIDDTLFDYSGSARAGILAHLAEVGLLARFRSPDAAAVSWQQIMEEEYGRFLAGELTFGEQQRSRAVRFLAGLGVITEDPEAWYAGYTRHHHSAWTAFPDALPTLRALTGRYRLGVVSNSSLAHQRGKLQLIGLGEFFEERTIVCSAEHGQAKPEPGIFLAGCAMLGLEPGEVAYVGDKYDVDALGAQAAGLRPYWLDRSGCGAGAAAGVTVISSLAELV